MWVMLRSSLVLPLRVASNTANKFFAAARSATTGGYMHVANQAPRPVSYCSVVFLFTTHLEKWLSVRPFHDHVIELPL